MADTAKKEKILIIESDASFGGQLVDALKKDGYGDIILQSDAASGEKAMYDAVPHLIIIGINLPGNSSYDIISKKLAEPMLAKIPLFLISTQGMPINMRLIPEGSVSEFIISLHPDPMEIVTKVNSKFSHTAPADAEPAPASSGPMKKLLWVEDDRLIGSILAKKLTASGFDLHHAKNGEEAVAMLKQMVPDAIALDLMLPGMSGFDILQTVKQEERLKSVPVVILSNLSKQSDIERAKALGAQKFMVKAAVSLDQIVEEMRALTK